MRLGCYSIERHRDCWIISVGDAKLLICSSKKTAVKTIRRATLASHEDLSDTDHSDWRYRREGTCTAMAESGLFEFDHPQSKPAMNRQKIE